MDTPDDLVTCLDCKHLKCVPCSESDCGSLFCGWNHWRIDFSEAVEEEFRIMLNKAPDCRSFQRPEPPQPPGRPAGPQPGQIVNHGGQRCVVAEDGSFQPIEENDNPSCPHNGGIKAPVVETWEGTIGTESVPMVGVVRRVTKSKYVPALDPDADYGLEDEP